MIPLFFKLRWFYPSVKKPSAFFADFAKARDQGFPNHLAGQHQGLASSYQLDMLKPTLQNNGLKMSQPWFRHSYFTIHIKWNIMILISFILMNSYVYICFVFRSKKSVHVTSFPNGFCSPCPRHFPRGLQDLQGGVDHFPIAGVQRGPDDSFSGHTEGDLFKTSLKHTETRLFKTILKSTSSWPLWTWHPIYSNFSTKTHFNPPASKHELHQELATSSEIPDLMGMINCGTTGKIWGGWRQFSVQKMSNMHEHVMNPCKMKHFS